MENEVEKEIWNFNDNEIDDKGTYIPGTAFLVDPVTGKETKIDDNEVCEVSSLYKHIMKEIAEDESEQEEKSSELREASGLPMTPMVALDSLVSSNDWLRKQIRENKSCSCNACYLCAYKVLKEYIKDKGE
jgi:hypothetical protein